MNTDNPQTEAQTVLEELGLTARAYEHALDGLSFIDLKEECMRQYRLSGEMLDKYRTSSSKLSETRTFLSNLQYEQSQLRHDLDTSEMAVMSMIDAIKFIKTVAETAKDYTHSMKRTATAIIVDVLNSKLSNLETVVYRREQRNNPSPNRNNDIPF